MNTTTMMYRGWAIEYASGFRGMIATSDATGEVIDAPSRDAIMKEIDRRKGRKHGAQLVFRQFTEPQHGGRLYRHVWRAGLLNIEGTRDREYPFVPVTKAERGGEGFRCYIEAYSREPVAHVDLKDIGGYDGTLPENGGFRLVIQGASKGGRRYHYYPRLLDAQEHACRWARRRFYIDD